MSIVIIVCAITCGIGLVCNAFVASSVMRNIDKIGDLPKLKAKTIHRNLFNIIALGCLTIILLARSVDFFDDRIFIGVFFAILGGLGFKITGDIFYTPSDSDCKETVANKDKSNKEDVGNSQQPIA